MKEIIDNLEYCSNKLDYTLKPNECEILLNYIKGLEDNWNKLKEIVKSQSDFKLKARFKEVWFEVDELLSKMEELERSDSDV